MDFVNGGDMFFHLQNEHNFSPARARFYAAQIVLGLEYLHSCGVIYRDLKAENIILNDDGYILMTDFGISKEGLFENDSRATTFCGTPEYLAPEILAGRGYTKAVDWWALGIFIFEMLTGNPPFYSQDVQTMYDKIAGGQIKFPEKHQAAFDGDTRSIITAMLARDPNKRLTDPTQIKNHAYFQSMNWEKLVQKELTPPYKPQVKDKTDVSMVDPCFTRQTVRLTQHGKLSAEHQKQFENFTSFSREE